MSWGMTSGLMRVSAFAFPMRIFADFFSCAGSSEERYKRRRHQLLVRYEEQTTETYFPWPDSEAVSISPCLSILFLAKSQS